MKHLLMALWFMFLVGCMQNESASLPEMIAEKHAFEDCNIWVELGDGNETYIRVGYSGACSKLTIAEYSKYIDAIFREFDVNKNNYPNVGKVYVNSYMTDGALNDELMSIINQSNVWKLNAQVCDEKNLNREFKKFNDKENYLSLIENVIKNNFKGIKDMKFDGVLPYYPKGLYDETNKCYPDSFGVATYLLIVS